MGLRMAGNSIHMPSVASGATNGHGGSDQRSLTELISEKDKIESELSALSSVLDSHHVNMNTGLTTFDGYPRDDMDIAQIRTTRARIIHLRNDYKDLMSKIETGLHAHFASAGERPVESPEATPATTASSSTPRVQQTRNEAAALPEAPFAKVNSVITGSPADSAGLEAGDEILRFGSVNYMNHDKLRKVAEVVQQNQERPLPVRASRRSDTGQVTTVDLQLTPRSNWGGRGLLGCHLLPL